MDSMKSLNTSLPRASSSRRAKSQQLPPGQLVAAFKSAALSVTNLYRTAAADQTRAHEEGYQEALSDLLQFLDQKNFGLRDGEGWHIRQWATERSNGLPATTNSDSDEEVEEEKRARSSSPIMHDKSSPEVEQLGLSAQSLASTRPESAPPSSPNQSTEAQTIHISPPQAEFSYQSAINYPSHHGISMEVSTPSASTPHGLQVRHRHGRPSNRHPHRQNSRNNGLGAGPGTKRKAPDADFFEFGFGNTQDWNGNGANKRGRLT